MRKLLIIILAASAVSICLFAPASALACKLPGAVYVPDFCQEMRIYWQIWGPIPYGCDSPTIKWGEGEVEIQNLYEGFLFSITHWKGGETVSIPQGPWDCVSIEAYEEGPQTSILRWKWKWEKSWWERIFN